MKVLLVGDYPPPFGGIAVHIWHLRRTLPGADVECRVLNIGGGRRIPSDEYESVRSPLDLLRKASRGARDGYVLHLFTNGENWKSWAIALAVGLIGRVRHAATMLTVTSGGAPTYLAGAGFASRTMARLAVTLPSEVICRTDAIAAGLARLRRREIRVMPAFTLARMRPAASLPVSLATFVRAHKPLLVSVAILRREYDVPTLLQAFCDIRKERSAAGLVVVGGGEDEAKVRDLVRLSKLEDSVLLTGWVPYDQCLAIVREADVFVRTTLYDGDASSVREALALGIPVVATRTDSRPPGCLLVAPGSPEALGEGLRRALAEPTRAKALQSGPANDDELLSLYHDVARRHSRRRAAGMRT